MVAGWPVDRLQTRRGEVGPWDSMAATIRALVPKLGARQHLAQYAIWSPDGKTVYIKAAGDEAVRPRSVRAGHRGNAEAAAPLR